MGLTRSPMSRGSGFKQPTRERMLLAFPSPIRRVAPTVISQIIRPVVKNPRYVDRHLLDMARGQVCLLKSPLCNHSLETTVACHGSGVAQGKGLGYKCGDHLVVNGCSSCNYFTDAYGGATAAEKKSVFEAGHLRQIDAWQAISCNHNAPLKDRSSAAAALLRIRG